MPALDAFKQIPPYATELFGVYQPLLGWRSRQTQQRVATEQAGALRKLVYRLEMAAVRAAPTGANGANGADGTATALWVGSALAAHLHAKAQAISAKRGANPTPADWRRLTAAASLGRTVNGLARTQLLRTRLSAIGTTAQGITIFPRGTLTAAEVRAVGARPIAGTANLAAAAADSRPLNLARENAVAQVATWLAKNSPEVLERTLLRPGLKLPRPTPFIDPLADFDSESVDAMLSPVGLVNVYRQYFFEFDSFLGAPVGHVWVSPGGSVELVEISMRRITSERTTDILSETTTRSERETIQQDELSNAVKEDNQRDVKLGVSSSVRVDFGIVQSEASATFGLDTSRRLSVETVHKRMRQQSERLSSEVRKSFRTTFRASTETTDSSSRRYVLANTTDKLVNYELRRKMRRVGVQVQHIATQLCWQVFVADPGDALRLSRLVHEARTEGEDSSVPPPEAPAQMQPKQTELPVEIPFKALNDHDNRDDLYKFGYEDGDRSGDRIQHRWDFEAPPPDVGYILKYVALGSIEKIDPEEDLPGPVAARYERTGDKTFRITLESVNFNDQPAIRFLLNLQWDPPDQAATQVAYEEKLKDYTNKLQDEGRARALRAIRERIEMESNVPQRPAADLRAEERSVIYRNLIAQLMGTGGAAAPYVTSELIRSLFDVDRMLYFVGEDWWRPRPHDVSWSADDPSAPAANVPAPTNVFGVMARASSSASASGVMALGSTAAASGMASRRPTYPITEDSHPAPLGASLGWLLQLDGDDHRNAFLNAPWVKTVLPIREGREVAALNWLIKSHVEGSDGFDDANGDPVMYSGTEPDLEGKTLRSALFTMARKLAQRNRSLANSLKTETVYETGFNPLAPAFQSDAAAYAVFDQWTEILPTDQVVAREY